MTRSTCRTVAVSLAVLAAALAVPAALAAPRAATTDTIRLGIRFHESSLDLGAPGPSLGDVQILNDRLVNRHGAVVGHDAGVCTITSLAPPETSCTVTFALRGGQIATQFLNSPPPRKTASIVGGTRRYRGATGQLRLIENPDQTGRVIFRLTRR